VIDRRTAELREIASRKAAAYRAGRVGGTADIIVTRGGSRCEGVTEDFLTVRLSTPVPRATRLCARLTMEQGQLVAVPDYAGGAASRYLSAS
jgi:hypothetical protein